MEARLREIIKLALKYNGTDIHINKYPNETTLEMRVDGTMRKLKYKLGDEKLMGYVSYICDMEENYDMPQTKQFDIIVDDKFVQCRAARLGDCMVIRIMHTEDYNDTYCYLVFKWPNSKPFSDIPASMRQYEHNIIGKGINITYETLKELGDEI